MRRITTWTALTLVLLTAAVVGQEADEDIIEMHGVDKIETLLGFVTRMTGKTVVYDAAIKTNAACHLLHIATGFFTKVGNFVNESNLRRQECVRRIFDNFRCLQIGCQYGCVTQVQWPIKLP